MIAASAIRGVLPPALRRGRRRVLPGFGLTMGATLLYLALIVLLPVAALLLKTADAGWLRFWDVVSSPRAVAAFQVTVGAALLATLFNAAYGLLMAWVLTRYRFPGRRILDALMDLPFALPTAVAGIALAALFAGNGWFGQFLEPGGIKVAYTLAGVAVAMAFTSVPFVVRTVQPVIEELKPEVEEAAASLGASRWQVFARVIYPALFPAHLAGSAMAFARSLGEFGAVIFIAGNLPFKTEIAALLIFIRLEEYDYPAAAAIATVLLAFAFLLLLATNTIQAWRLRRAVKD
ncbi:MAG: sulfate ABC transporter permease subunit CysT [Alphaproteobacteria bacterium]